MYRVVGLYLDRPHTRNIAYAHMCIFGGKGRSSMYFGSPAEV